MRRLNGWLTEYCERELDCPEEVSLLYRMLHEGHIQRPPSRDKVLCPDHPIHIRIMRSAMRQLPDLERNCIWMKFSYPINDRGQLYRESEICRFLGIKQKSYQNYIYRGKKRLTGVLTRMVA